jgi:hypothetical protein
LKEGEMKKQSGAISFFTVLCFLFGIWLPCQAADDLIYACKNIKTGTPRLVSSPNKCKTKTEYAVTLNGTFPQNPIPNFQGTICWAAHKTEDENGPVDENFIFMMNIAYRGGDYYTVQGIANVSSDNPYFFDGGAVIKDNNIIFSGAGSQEHSSPYRDSGILHASFDKSTLNGNLWSSYMSFNTSTRETGINYSAGTLTLTTCP